MTPTYPISLSNNPGYRDTYLNDPDFYREEYDRDEAEEDADVQRAEEERENQSEEND